MVIFVGSFGGISILGNSLFPPVGDLEHFVFSHILGIIITIDFHIFQRDRFTTNQSISSILSNISINLVRSITVPPTSLGSTVATNSSSFAFLEIHHIVLASLKTWGFRSMVTVCIYIYRILMIVSSNYYYHVITTTVVLSIVFTVGI